RSTAIGLTMVRGESLKGLGEPSRLRVRVPKALTPAGKGPQGPEKGGRGPARSWRLEGPSQYDSQPPPTADEAEEDIVSQAQR
ncbi:hypothetical protein THAOC_34202, partial [Thalassiosira oceanica]